METQSAAAPSAGGQFPFNFDSLLKDMSEEDLYNAFLNNSQQNSASSDIPPVQLSTVEASEFPDLSALDLSEYLLQPIKQEPTEEKANPRLVEVLPEKRKSPREASKVNKKARVIKPETKPEPVKVEFPTGKYTAGTVKKEDKYQKRLQANKRSAQASRERKKALKIELEQKVDELVEENAQLGTAITELETENKVLKNEFIHLQRLIGESSILTKLMARANMSLLPPEVPETADGQANRNAANPTAFFYLMIVLYTFNQHFNQMRTLPTSLPGKITGTVPSISSVA
eukprot:TRINITY_DN4956_c0_g1_i1.p1 TRINITY_DN4956_c0_g1~~TRINITY_DN4956_c0_g1_i1.p1  ORF type:complete len:287 (-),score=60.95 TRINITY_DN4956_c0_g1_i1:73-933(-)